MAAKSNEKLIHKKVKGLEMMAEKKYRGLALKKT